MLSFFTFAFLLSWQVADIEKLVHSWRQHHLGFSAAAELKGRGLKQAKDTTHPDATTSSVVSSEEPPSKQAPPMVLPTQWPSQNPVDSQRSEK